MKKQKAGRGPLFYCRQSTRLSMKNAAQFALDGVLVFAPFFRFTVAMQPR
ncbi:MAG: hypothetical protein HGA71_16695 [Azonexaceae bacterium]|nr:hypothetical protein [Azonexaceae bacterium]